MKLVKLCVLVLVVWAAVGVAGQAVDLGETAFQQGRFEEAAAYWEKALSNPSPGITPTDMIEITVRLAGAYQELGKLQMARHLLTQPALCEQIDGLKDFDSQNEAKAKILNQLSEVHFALPAAKDDQKNKDSVLPACLSSTDGKDSIHVLQRFCNKQPDSNGQNTDDKALDYAYRALSVVPFSNAWLKANVFNNIGNILATRKDDCKALSAYWKSAELADKSGDYGLSTKARLNFLQLQIARQREERNESFSCNGVENCPFDGKLQQPRSLLPLVEKLPDSHDKTFALISLANLEKELANLNKTQVCQQEDTRQFRQGVLENAKKIAEAQHDKNALGYVRLYLAELETEKCSCEGETKNCYSNPIKSIEETIKYQAQSYPSLQKFSTSGTEQFWIRQADSFVSSRFNWPLSPNVTPEQREKCKDWCKQYSSPCVQDKLPDECKDVCRSGPTLFLRDYHPELSFRLEWQRGKVYKAQYDTEKQRDAETQGKIQKDVDANGQAHLQEAFEAKAKEQLQKVIDAYDSAVNYLQLVRQYSGVSSSFGKEVEKFYLEWADLLLQLAKLEQNQEKQQALFKTAINGLELFNKAELQNYFQDECVTEKLADKDKVKAWPQYTAVLYIFLLDDRVELLVNSNDHVQRFSVAEGFTPEELKKEASQLEKAIKYITNRSSQMREECTMVGRLAFEKCEVETEYDYRPHVKKIYNGLFTEALTNAIEWLRGKGTLIIVPVAKEDRLFGAPFAALYNERTKKYLIEEYALVVSYSSKAGMQAAIPKISQDDLALLNGLTTVGLPKIGEQLRDISQLLINSDDPLIDAAFTVSNVETKLEGKSYSILHFATHGVFGGTPDNIYLVALNELLTLNHLETLLNGMNSPLKLLTLSACESALGNENSRMGLAGVAVKAGSLSALGTLWKVVDDSTAKLMVKFYQEAVKTTAAKALQTSQLLLLNTITEGVVENVSDPYYWAAFTLIGGPE
jgi:CHAT domain-containing protein